MASVSIQKRGAGRWRVRWREAPQAPERSRSFARKADAEVFRDRVRADLQRGEFVDPARGMGVTFGEFGVQWMAGQRWRPRTMSMNESNWRLHVEPAFGSRPVGSVRPSEFQQWVNGFELAPRTVWLVSGLASSVFTAAVADRLIVRSPAEGVKLPKAERSIDAPLTVAEVQEIAAADESIGAAVLFAAMTGLRQGELFGLTGSRVDWLRREVMIDRQLVSKGKVWQFGPPKSVRSVRRVPVSDRGLEILSGQVAACGLGGEDGFLFHHDGLPFTRGLASSRFRRAMVRSIGRPGGWHLLRHHCASVLIAQQVGVTGVAAVLGHSEAECWKTYAAWFPDQSDQLRNAITAAWTPEQKPGLRAVD